MISMGGYRTILLRTGLLLAGGLALSDCYVRGSTGGATGTINVQPATVVAQPAPVYVQPRPVGVVVAQPGVYASPPGVVGGGVGGNVGGVGVGVGVNVGAVGSNWVTNGYAEQDFVSYNMSLRARQFAAGFMPVTQLFRSTLYQGGRQFMTVDAQPGRCYRIVGVGGPGVRDLDLRLRDMSGNVIDQDVATDNFPVLGLQRPLCLNWAGTFQIEVIMYAGGGEFGVQAFAN